MQRVPVILVPKTAVSGTAVYLPTWLVNRCHQFADQPQAHNDPDWAWEQFKRDIEGQFAATDIEMGILS